MRYSNVLFTLAAGMVSAGAAGAATITADTVLDFQNSGTGAGPAGDVPYGEDGGPQNVAVPFSAALADDSSYVSLPTGSFLTLGFSGGFVFDGDGDDLFIGEIGGASELADIEVSSDFGSTFTFLATADGGTVTGIDFADFSFSGNVNAVRITGLDNRGSAPGFDVNFVSGLEGSVVEEPQGPSGPAPIPVPAAFPLLGGALAGLSLLRRRRKSA